MHPLRIIVVVCLASVSATLFGWGIATPSRSERTSAVAGGSEQRAVTASAQPALAPGWGNAFSTGGGSLTGRLQSPGVRTARTSSTTSGSASLASVTSQRTPEVVRTGTQAAQMIKSRRSFDGDVRRLPKTAAKIKPPRPEFEAPDADKYIAGESVPVGAGSAPETLSSPAPSASASFEGIHFNESCTGGQCGDGHPPDTNGDVGPTYYIQTVNTAIGIYDKSTGTRVAGFTYDNFMSQGSFGNLCDTDNYGDPVVLYDTFTDRWIITDFAFQVDSHGNITPQVVYQCFAVSKTGDPVGGGWNYYSILINGGIDDYPKFGIWPDGLYMSSNMFGYSANAPFQNVRVFAFNKAQMYAGAQSIQVVSFDLANTYFTLLPSNARAQAGTPPNGRENLYASVWNNNDRVSVWKFHVDWNNTANSTFTGPTDVMSGSTWTSAPSTVQESGGNNLDTLATRLMMQNQYANIGGLESLWDSHTVQGSTSTQAAVRWYQLNVTGGTINTIATQAATWNPDTKSRFMPSTAVDHLGNMAIGYSVSSSSSFPAISYAGRLTTDPVNTLGQTETSLINGTGAQTGTCGQTCTRWGDYSAMSLDTDGCTFWYTNEYYVTSGLDDHTRIGSFKFSQCTPLGNGTVEGTVKRASDNTPIMGATVTINSDTRTTDTSGFYSFGSYPVGTYSVTASAPGFVSTTAGSVMVNQNATTTQNFTLTAAPSSACLVDTTQADFQAGTASSVDLTTSSGDVKLTALNGADTLDQQQTQTSSFGFSADYEAQTFKAGLSGKLTKADIFLSTGNTASITVSIYNTSNGAPTGGAIASTTLTPTATAQFFTATFLSPATVTTGTTYALVLFRSGGSSWIVCSNGNSNCTSTYANGNAYTSSDGSNWTVSTTKQTAFRTYVAAPGGFSSAGNLVSSTKDSNPAANATATWTTLSWTATTPANTTVKFQVAGSNSTSGPFSFVGPDSTANTFFTTSGASLSQFTGLRYLKYKAYLSTTNSNSTPTLSDVTICFNNVSVANTSLAVSSATGTYGGTTNLSATLTSGGNPVSGKSISFTVNGSPVGSAPTNGGGLASLSNVSLAGINAGTYATGVAASFAGDSTYASSGGTNSLTISPANQTISIGTHAPINAAYNSQFTVAATATSGLPVSYSSSGVCTNNGATFTMTSGTGTCTVLYDQAGDNNYNVAPQVMESVTATKVGTSTGVTSSLNPSNSGQQVTFTATVTSGAGIPTGTVQFKDGANNLGAAASLDNNGQASVSTSSLTVGTHTITGNYSGSTNYSSSSGTVAGGQAVRSTNGNLSGLSLSAGAISPAFSAANTSYTLNVPNSTTSTTVTPSAADTNATITVNNVAVTSGNASGSINLNVGDNTITTVVTAQDQTTTKSYTVIVTRAGVAQIAVEQPPGTDLTSGTSQVDFGGVAPNGDNSKTFIIRNDGTADLTGLNITFDGMNSLDFSVSSAPTAPVSPGGNTAFTVKFAPIATGSRSAGLHIASNDPNTSSFEVGLTGTGYTYSEAWRLQYFGSIDNSGDGADLNDFEHDGLTNLMEFATASDPTQPSTAPGEVELNGNNLEFTYTRSDGALSDGIVFDVEWSDDLAAWSTQGVSESILSDNGTIQLVKATVSAGTGPRFIHLKVTRP